MIKLNVLYIYSGLCGGPQACSGFPASANQIMPEHAAAEYQLNPPDLTGEEGIL
jgi:hypothetical protein